MTDDWLVNASDEEWSVYNDSSSLNDFFVPERLIKLYPEIQSKKVLPLYNCYCPRKGKEPVKEIHQPAQTPKELSPVDDLTPQVTEKCKDEPADVNKTFEAFEFDDDEEKQSVKRKTPASVKRVKREKEKVSGSMSNVINDMRRSKLLDEMEAKKNDQENTVIKEEGEMKA